MTENKSLLDRIKELPNELQIRISEYNPNHRERMQYVFEELDNVMNWCDCDNDMCERDFYLFDETAIEMEISGNIYRFCCQNCASYGRWSIQYDYRKYRRKINQEMWDHFRL